MVGSKNPTPRTPDPTPRTTDPTPRTTDPTRRTTDPTRRTLRSLCCIRGRPEDPVRPTPRTLLAVQRDALGKHLDGIRHADPESVHDARVASRKMRELLPLYLDQRDERYGEVRDLGRRLGMVRDCDVEIELLDEFALRVPRAASLLAERRHSTMQVRENRLRQVIKKLPDGTDEFTSAFPIPAAHALNDHLWSAGWRERLRSRLADRRRRVLDALRHATSVYFPNRLHGARVAIKKLRYSAEVAHETGPIADLLYAFRDL